MNYVIIGGVAAGMSAAMEIYRTDENANITVLEQGEDYSYGQCGLPYVINGVVSSIDKLIAIEVETFRDKYGIDARVNTKVYDMNVDDQVVRVLDKETNDEFTINYDRLLIASGSSPIFPDWEGRQLEGIHTLKTIPDTKGIMKDLGENVHNVTVVGGGYIGLEMAESFVSLGKKVTLIQRGPQIANIFDQDMAELIHEKAKEKGIHLVLNESVQGFEGKERVESIRTDKKTMRLILC